jgi:integrase
MARPNRIWFRKDIGWWMITLGGKKIRLIQGKENKKLAEQKFHELAALQARIPEAPSARVADVIESFLAWAKRHRSEETLRNYLWYGEQFSEHSGYISVSELKPIHLTRWLDTKAWGQTTERNARRSIYRAFSWACEEGIVPANPLKGIRCPKAKTRERMMTRDEYTILMKNGGKKFRKLLFALRQTGCRPKEARLLKWSQVHGDKWVLKEHKTAHVAGKPRVIYLTKPMQRLMTNLRRKATSECVFANTRGKPWSSNALRLCIQRIKDKTNLAKDVSAYLLRHAFGTNAIINGVDVTTVAELMGHSSLEMISKVYCHLAGEHRHLQNAVDRINRPASAAKPQPVGTH